MSDRQIKELEEKSGKPARETIIFSPATGFVTEKTVLEGQQIMPNDSLAVIADISHVWGEADIYEADMPYVTVGMPVSISLSYLQGKTFKGEIGFLYPFLDPQTRTLKARIEIPNPGNTLKPDMYAEAKMVYSVSQQIAVPEQAIMRTGTTDYVFVKGAEDTVFKREVQLGIRSSDGYFEVTSGLLEGEAVVASANFLVDSESSLKEAFRAAKEGHTH
jgi:RND family efflux transporter MFP subunit